MDREFEANPTTSHHFTRLDPYVNINLNGLQIWGNPIYI